MAPEKEGLEENPYYETITFSAIGNVTNAESQILAAVHYRQIVQRKSNDQIFHDETGYWMWDAQVNVVMHSLNIPRAVSLLAGGVYNDEKSAEGSVLIKVSAALNDKDWQIIQSPFMRDNACTKEFHHQINISNGKLLYKETTMVEIYGKVFEHTDQNELIRQ